MYCSAGTLYVNTVLRHTYVVRQFEVDELAVFVDGSARKWRSWLLNKRFTHDRAAKKKKSGLIKLKKKRFSLPGILLTLPAHEGTRVDRCSYQRAQMHHCPVSTWKKLLQFPPDLTHEYVATTHALTSTKQEVRISYFLLG